MASGVARRAVSCPLVAPLPAPLCASHSHRRARQHPGGRNITYASFAGDENRSHRYAASASTIAAVTPLLGSRRRRKDGAWGTGGKSNDTCSCDIGPGGRWGELGWGEKRGGAAMTTLLVRAKEGQVSRELRIWSAGARLPSWPSSCGGPTCLDHPRYPQSDKLCPNYPQYTVARFQMSSSATSPCGFSSQTLAGSRSTLVNGGRVGQMLLPDQLIQMQDFTLFASPLDSQLNALKSERSDSGKVD